MRSSNWLWRFVAASAAAVPLASVVVVNAAAPEDAHPNRPAVFVQTNDPAGNAIVVFHREADGRLVRGSTYPTGGNGGRASGSTSDPLASQGSLIFDAQHNLLFAVNAGSDSISVFGDDGTTLHRHQVIASGGSFPTSIAVHQNALYVLNAGGSANVSGFRISEGKLDPLRNDTVSLGLTESNPPDFLASPAEVGFTPDGQELIVTGKTNNFIDVFKVLHDLRLWASPVRTTDGSVPFAFAFAPADQLDLVNAAGNLAPSAVKENGTITPTHAPVADGQKAACWIALAGDFAYVANTGSNDVSAYHIGDRGAVRLVSATAASGVNGATDETTSGGQFLYVQVGLGSAVNAYHVNPDGSLSLIQAAAVPDGSSQEGIAAS